MKEVYHLYFSMRPHPSRIVSLFLVLSIASVSFLPQLAFAQEEVSSDVADDGVGDTPQTDHSAQVTSTEVKESLENISGLLNTSDQVVVKTDVDSAATVTTGSTIVDIPKDPEDPVNFTVNGVELEIELPQSEQAKDAQIVAPGVVAYAANNGSANAVQADEQGAVRMLTIIDNANAPAEYDYTVTVPDGGHIELTFEGGALVLDGDGEVIAAVDVPWAKDAQENVVTTWFTTDGTTLTQHIDHVVSGVVYPVSADPRFALTGYGPTIFLTKNETYYVSLGLYAYVGALTGPWGSLISTVFGNKAADWARDNNRCIAFYTPWFATSGSSIRSFMYSCK